MRNSKTTTSEQTSKCLAYLKAIRKEIDSILDTAEERTMERCKVFEADVTKENNQISKRIGSKIKVTRQTLQDLTKIKNLATNFQIYASLKVLRTFVSEQETEIRSLKEEGYLREKLLSIYPNPVLSNLRDKVESLALLEKTDKKSNLELEILEADEKQAFLHTISTFNAMKSILSKILLRFQRVTILI